MVQRVEEDAAVPETLILITGSHMVEGEKQPQ